MNDAFLPVHPDELKGPDKEVDVVLITGEAYVDHPAFGTAVIGRVLEADGWRVGIISMPDWKNPASIAVFGKPRLFFGISSGNVDSMVSRYTSFKRLRSDDPYVPGDTGGKKPDRAVIVYANLVRRTFKDVPIVIGGLEASMRRMPHYDFWDNKVRRSIIEDSRAAILVYGMGEPQVREIAKRLDAGQDLAGIPGTVYLSKTPPPDAMLLPPGEEVIDSKRVFTEFYGLFYRNRHRLLAVPSGGRFLVQVPHEENLSSADLDAIYDLPFVREPHPVYKEKIPAFDMICNSITAHRGCVSGCSFCSLTLHQGKRIISRSEASILREINKITKKKYFKGHITDIGGPSANMYGFACKKKWHCPRESCLFPSLCPNLEMKPDRWLKLLDKGAKCQGVKKVTVGSGIRYDLLVHKLLKNAPKRKGKGAREQVFRGNPGLQEFFDKHISGQLKIAPEHTSRVVLRAMRKTPLVDLETFVAFFSGWRGRGSKERFLLPYLMSCHPGSNWLEMKKMKKQVLALFGYVPQQVQAFLPLPMTLSAAIYYTGEDALTGERFAVERDGQKRRQEHDIFFQPGR